MRAHTHTHREREKERERGARLIAARRIFMNYRSHSRERRLVCDA